MVFLGNDRKNINSGASARDGVFAKSPRCDNQGRTEVRGKKQVLRFHVRTWGLSEANLLYWRKHLRLGRDFSAPPEIRRPGIFAPLVMSPAGAALCDKLRSCEIRRALNVELLLRTERSKPRYFCHVSGMPKERLASQVLLVKPTGKSAQRSSKDQVEWLHLRPCLVRSWRWATRTIWNCCWQWSIPSPPIGMLPRDPP